MRNLGEAQQGFRVVAGGGGWGKQAGPESDAAFVGFALTLGIVIIT